MMKGQLFPGVFTIEDDEDDEWDDEPKKKRKKKMKIRKKKPLNFTKNGFTKWGLVEYGKLRRRGIPSEKAIGMMIKEDKNKLKKVI
jgi:hypothetical protein